MRLFSRLRSWLRAAFRRSRAEREMDAELRFHMETYAEDLVRSGVSHEEAMRRARIEFGGIERVKEECRESRGVSFIETLAQDLRYGLRMLRKSPGFTAVAVLTLAIGIGANATIFSFVNALLMHIPSGVAAPSRLVAVWNRLPNGQEMQFSYPDYLYFRDHNDVFSDFIAYSSDPTQASWTQSGESSLVGVRLVSANYFQTLGASPIVGRGFLPSEDTNADAAPVVVVSYRFWRDRLGSDRAILGRSVTLNARAFTVIGVAPPDFSDLEPGFETAFWAPLTMQKTLAPGSDLLTNGDGYWIFVVGRLKPGVTRQQAQADLKVVANQLAREHPETKKGWTADVSPISGLDPETRGLLTDFSALIMAVTGLVLLIVCANAANLLLAQASKRRHEMTIRAALGAQRNRIFRQVLTESALLSLMAGGIAILFSSWAGPLILALKPPMLSFIQLNLPLDWHMVAFTALVSVATGLVFGLAPALQSSKIDVATRLKDGSLGSWGKSRFRSILVVAQVAVCLVLLIGASLCLRSLMNAQSIDPGFRISDGVVVELDPQILGYSDVQAKAFYSDVIARIKGLPGVRSVSVTNYLPLGFESISQSMKIEGRPASDTKNVAAGAMFVGPGYFATMGIPVINGREFRRDDNGSAPSVVIVNEALAERYWPGRSPIGKRISLNEDARHRQVWSEIVGVVSTGKYRSLREEPEPFVYHCFLQAFDPHATIVIHTGGNPRAMLSLIHHAVQAVNPALPILNQETMQSYMSVPLFPAHITGVLLGAFGGLALLVAMVGLYGVIAYVVVQRTHEIGIRMALGAKPDEILRLIIGRGLKLALIGTGIGVTAAFGATRVLSSLLYGISPTDPVTFVAIPILLVIVALAACYVPARRAMRVDPMVALRYE